MLITRGLQGDVVYLCRPINPSYIESKCGGRGDCGASANECSCAHHVTWSPNKLRRSTSIFNLRLSPKRQAISWSANDPRPVLHLDMSGQQKPCWFWTCLHDRVLNYIHLDVSTLQRPAQHLVLSTTPQESERHLYVSKQHGWACASSRRVYTSEDWGAHISRLKKACASPRQQEPLLLLDLSTQQGLSWRART
jgi:hypothetical protein